MNLLAIFYDFVFAFLILQSATAASVNPTAIQIVNETSLTLNYGLTYDDYSDKTIKPDEAQNSFGQQPRGAAGWDRNLARSGMQPIIKLLKPGYQYAFKIV